MGDHRFEPFKLTMPELLDQRALALARLTQAEERDDHVSAAAARKVVQDLQRAIRDRNASDER